MEYSAGPPERSRRTRWVVAGGLVALGVAIVAFGPSGMVLRMLAMPLHRPSLRVWVDTVNGIGLITVAALPVAALVAWALARRRGAAGDASAWRKSLCEVGIVYGTAPSVWLIMLPGARAGEVSGYVTLVPFRDLVTMDTGQIVGNLLVFAVLGFCVPLRFRALASLPRILALAAACSVFLETAQYVLRLDRVTSIDDVLLNTTGAVLAALASRPWWRPGTASRISRRSPRSERGSR